MTTTTKNSMKIVRIIRVVDTRTYEEVGDDRWEPIPGSGDENQCARCGRMHEVHAHVLLEDNSSAVVGTGCARGDDLVKASAFASAANASKRIAQLRARLTKAEADAAIYELAADKVDVMTPPAAVWTKEPNRVSSGEHHVITVGEGKAYSYQPGELSHLDRREREECARSGWRAARLVELLPAGFRLRSYQVGTLKRDIARAEKRLAQLTAAPAAVTA
jgi:hypothetical protein